MKEAVITCTLCIISSSLFCFQQNFFFSLCKPAVLSLNYNAFLDAFLSQLQIMGVMEGIPIHVSFSSIKRISLKIPFLPCVPSAFSAPPPWQMSSNAQVVVKLPLFSKWNLTILKLLQLLICVLLRRGRLHWAVWSGLVTEEQMLSGGGEGATEEWGNLSTLVKMKDTLPLRLTQR